jgi:hypothetical protein
MRGFLVVLGAVGGYLLRVLYDWYVSWRQEVREDRHRWKAARLEVLNEAGDCATDLHSLISAHQRQGSAAWQEPGYANEVTALLRRMERVEQRLLLLSAHRETLDVWGQAKRAVTACLPPLSADHPWDPASQLQHARQMVYEIARMSRTRELGLLHVGILAYPPDQPRWRQRYLRWRLRVRELRRG